MGTSGNPAKLTVRTINFPPGEKQVADGDNKRFC